MTRRVLLTSIAAVCLWASGAGDAVAIVGAQVPATPQPTAPVREIVATVEGREITGERFLTEYRRRLDAYKSAYGDKLDPQAMKHLGVPQVILQQLIDEEAELVEAERLGIQVSPVDVQARIRSLPALQDQGRFVGEERLKEILAAQKPPLSAEAFAEAMRRNLVADALQETVTKGVTGDPAARVEAFKAYMAKAKETMRITIDTPLMLQLIER